MRLWRARELESELKWEECYRIRKPEPIERSRTPHSQGFRARLTDVGPFARVNAKVYGEGGPLDERLSTSSVWAGAVGWRTPLSACTHTVAVLSVWILTMDVRWSECVRVC